MKKKLLSGVVTLTLAAAVNAQAASFDITISNMDFGGITPATGILSGNDGVASGSVTSPFNSIDFVITATSVFDTTGPHTWADTNGGTPHQLADGTIIIAGDLINDDRWVLPFSYDFTLDAGQVAFGLSYDWGTEVDVPILAIFDCVDTVCTGTALPIGFGSSLTSQQPVWNGTLTAGAMPSAVPVPAAVWLFGSGLIGLAGVARRKKA